MATIIGQTTATKQATRYTESTESGRKATERWEGPAAAIVSLLPTVRGPGYSLRYELDGRTPYIEREASGASSPSQGYDDQLAEENAQWELMPVELRRDLKLAPYFVAGDAADIAAYEQVDIDRQLGINTLAKTYTTRGNRYRDLRAQGQDSYFSYNYTIRFVRVVGRDTNLAIDATGVNEVTAIPVPNIPAIVTFVQNLSFEWLKKAPSFQFLGGGRYQLTLEWFGASKWAANVYTGGSG